MKKYLITLLVLLMAFCACAEEPDFALNDDLTSLKVSLPAGEWQVILSDETILTQGETENTEDACNIEFLPTEENSGLVTLFFAQGEENGYVMEVNVSEGGTIEILDAYSTGESDDWYALDEEEQLLTVCLPVWMTEEYSWQMNISDETLLTCVEQETVEEWFFATFAPAEGASGEIEIVLRYAKDWEDEPEDIRVIGLLLSEEEPMQIVYAE